MVSGLVKGRVDWKAGFMTLDTKATLTKLDSSVSAVKQPLEQDGHVDKDLNWTTRPELSRAFIHYEVGGFEDISSRPEKNHLHTGAKETQRNSGKSEKSLKGIV